EPYGPILRTLAMYCTGIVSPTAVQKMGEGFSRAPVGPGPFPFVEWKTNTPVILERNPDYWGDKPPLDRVIFKVVPEEGARMIALQTGDADMVLLPAPAQLPALSRDPKYVIHEVGGGRVVFEIGRRRAHERAADGRRGHGAAARARAAPRPEPRSQVRDPRGGGRARSLCGHERRHAAAGRCPGAHRPPARCRPQGHPRQHPRRLGGA